MKIALPVTNNNLCTHLGHCELFEVFDIEEPTKKIIDRTSVDAPPHQPGLLPRWLAGKGVTCVIAGGMGSRAIELFNENGVTVVTGVQAGEPVAIVTDFLEGRLVTGGNVCDH